MKTRKYSFILMELMIGLSLMALVLGVIFSSLYQNATLKSRLDKGEEIVMRRAHIQQRLDQIFATIDQGDTNSLYTDEKGILHFHFDNGIDPDSAFCDCVPGEITKNGESLFLTVYGGKTPRKELLCKGVQSISCEFLYNNGKKMERASEWEKENTDSPFYIQMTLGLKGQEEVYVFWINQQNEGVPLKPHGVKP